MNKLSLERLKHLLSYDPETGIFVWINPQSVRVKRGMVAGSKRRDGYIEVGLDGKPYFAHRLAWLYVHGEFPPNRTDHINGERDDNRIANLRPATPAENQHNSRMYRNNTTGRKGVSFHRFSGLWRSEVMLHGERHFLGYFKSCDEAGDAYDSFVREAHGAFYRPDERIGKINEMKVEV